MASTLTTVTLPTTKNVGSLLHIDVTEFTKNVVKDTVEHIVSGEGIFDVLMMTATKHLQAQYEGNRIRKEDYATAYVEVYQATLQAALQAWLQKGVAEADIALKLAEIPLKEKELDLKTAQIQLALAELPLKEKDLALKDKELSLADKELALKEEQINLAKAEIPLKAKQIELMTAQIGLMTKQIEAELAKRDLYRRQIEGFDEDYKQKILKIMMDSWAVGFSVAKDSFQAEGTPAPMQKVTIDDLYNRFIKTDLDNNVYKRSNEVLNGYTS